MSFHFTIVQCKTDLLVGISRVSTGSGHQRAAYETVPCRHGLTLGKQRAACAGQLLQWAHRGVPAGPGHQRSRHAERPHRLLRRISHGPLPLQPAHTQQVEHLQKSLSALASCVRSLTKDLRPDVQGVCFSSKKRRLERCLVRWMRRYPLSPSPHQDPDVSAHPISKHFVLENGR